jgi:hypothetical protein
MSKCEPILDIYVSRAFQRYQERNNPLRFDPSTRTLKFQESTGTPSPKMGVARQLCALAKTDPTSFWRHYSKSRERSVAISKADLVVGFQKL